MLIKWCWFWLPYQHTVLCLLDHFVDWFDFSQIIHWVHIQSGELYIKETLGMGFQLCRQGMISIQALCGWVAQREYLTLTECSPRHSSKYSICMISFSTDSNAIKVAINIIIFIYLFYRRGNWGVQTLTCTMSHGQREVHQDSNAQFDSWACKRLCLAILSHLSVH